MGIRSRRAVALVTVLFLLVAGGLLALYLTSSTRRDVTTSSGAAYDAYREGIEQQRRFYMKEARVAFARALSLDPNFAMAMLRLADNSNSDQAKALVERASKLRNRLNERERLWVDFYAAGEKGNKDDRLKLVREIHEKYPEDIEAAQVLAGNQMAQGNYDDAIRIQMDLLAKDPNNAGVYNQVGYYYAYRGEYEKGIENLKKYQFMAPDQANPYDSLGEIQAYSGHYDEAIANLNKALALKPDFFESIGNLGVVYEGKGEPAKAIEFYLKAARETQIDGRKMDYYGSALRVALYSNDKKAVREIAERVAELPKNKDAELRKIYVEIVTDLVDGRAVEAEKKLNELRPKIQEIYDKENRDPSRKPHFPQWNLLMATAKLRQGQTDEAIALFEQNVNPPNRWENFPGRRWVYEARARLAALLAAKGDIDRAEKLLAENRAWNPSWAPTREAELAVAQARRDKVLSATGGTGDSKPAR